MAEERPSSVDWDAAADTFDDAVDHGLTDPTARAAWRRLMEAWLPPPPARVLDLGCATGSLALLAADAGHHVVGIDWSRPMLERARRKCAGHPAVSFARGDAQAAPVADGTVDVVLVRHVVWALPDPARALAGWVRCLRPRGRLVLVEGRWQTTADSSTAIVEGAPIPGPPAVAGISADDLRDMVAPLVATVDVQPLPDPALWGRPITDERYALVGHL